MDRTVSGQGEEKDRQDGFRVKRGEGWTIGQDGFRVGRREGLVYHTSGGVFSVLNLHYPPPNKEISIELKNVHFLCTGVMKIKIFNFLSLPHFYRVSYASGFYLPETASPCAQFRNNCTQLQREIPSTFLRLCFNFLRISILNLTELKTLERDILNPDCLIAEYPMYTLLIFFIILFFGYLYCIKVTFDNNYRYNAKSIGLISD